MKKLKIFYQYSHCKTLKPTGGDFINEINTCIALSRFAYVYYSGQKFDVTKADYGLKEYAGAIASFHPNDYDVYMIRANKDCFYRALGKPVLWLSSPYNEDIFNRATKIMCMTKAWENALITGSYIGALNPEGNKYKNTCTIYQTLTDDFKLIDRNNERIQIIRRNLGCDEETFVISCFGRLVKSNYPYLLLAAMPKLIEICKNIKFVFGITKTDMLPKNMPEEYVVFSQYDYNMMPYVLNAVDLNVINQHGIEWQICGSGKTIEAAACGNPVICERSDARQELLGDDYPLFMTKDTFDLPVTEQKINDFVAMVCRLMYDKKFRADISWRNQCRAKFYSIDNQAKRLEKLLNKII